MNIFKPLAVMLTAGLLLTGCSSNPEQVSYNKWKETAYKVEDLSYDNSDLKTEAQKNLKPLLDVLNKDIPHGRLKVNVDIVKDDNWKRNICKNYVDVAGDQILEPLVQPIIGFSEVLMFSGYVSVDQLKTIAKDYKAEIVESPDTTGILEGSDVAYPYEAKDYMVSTENDMFKVVVEANSGWNALVWEEYYKEEDPGLLNTKEFPFPKDDYMPMTVKVFYKPACEKV